VAVLVSALRARVDLLEHSAEELEDIRAALTPAEVVDLANVDAATAFVPSDHGVSGDFFLLTNGPDGSTIAIVGDVTGHGPEAARLATFVRARLAAFAANTSDPAEILSLANLALTDHPRPDHELVSAVCLRFEPEGEGLSWAVAGHPPPLRLPGLVELRPPGSTLVLGARADLDLRAGHTSLDSQGGVLVYTDGATDVRKDGRLLGLDGLRRLIGPLTALPADSLVSRAEDTILEWKNEPLRDDICLLMLKPAQPSG
jgi:serine phosphatase RsbU (regulator of sigma subunit)